MRNTLPPAAEVLSNLSGRYPVHENGTEKQVYPTDHSHGESAQGMEKLERVIERLSGTSQTLLIIVETALTGGGTVMTGRGAIHVPPLRFDGRLQDLKILTDLSKSLNDEISSKIQAWYEAKAEQEREVVAAMDEMGSPELVACYIMDVLKITPSSNLLREIGVGEEFIGSLVELGGLNPESVPNR